MDSRSQPPSDPGPSSAPLPPHDQEVVDFGTFGRQATQHQATHDTYLMGERAGWTYLQDIHARMRYESYGADVHTWQLYNAKLEAVAADWKPSDD